MDSRVRRFKFEDTLGNKCGYPPFIVTLTDFEGEFVVELTMRGCPALLFYKTYVGRLEAFAMFNDIQTRIINGTLKLSVNL